MVELLIMGIKNSKYIAIMASDLETTELKQMIKLAQKL